MTSMDTALVHLKRLASLAQAAGLKTVADELILERIPALESGALSVVVLGEFNHGKSTLLNALLGADVLPVGITPTTAVITRIVNGNPGVTVVFDDGKEQAVDRSDLEALVRDENDRVRHVIVRHPTSALAERVVLVDTPGVNDISQQRVEVTYGIVPRADVVILVLDATQVLKRTELRFIEKRLLSGLRDRLMFVIGKVDRLEDDEADEVERYARQRLEALLGPVEIFPLSARRAQRGGDPGFDRFKTHLERFLSQRRDLILLDSALSTGLRSGGALLGNLQIKRRSYQMATAELETRVQTVRDKLHESRRVISQNVARIEEATTNLTATARHNLSEFRDAFLDALPREIEKVSAEDVKKYLAGFIEDCFRTFLEKEGRALGKSLERLAEEIIAVTNQNLRETVDALNEELGVDPDALNVTIDSRAYDFSVFALGAFGVSVLVFINALVGGLIALATPVVAFVLKDRLDARVKGLATKAGMDTITVASTHAEKELVAMIEDFGKRLSEFVESAGDRLYRQINDALGTVLKEKAVVGSDSDALERTACVAEGDAREVVEALLAERKDLWARP